MGASKYFDRIAITLSAVCLVHCLAVPVLVAVLPIAALSFGSDGHFHALMLWFVVPTSTAGFLLGFRVHGRRDVVGAGAAGVLVLALAALWGHASWDPSVEVAVSVAGSITLAIAHFRNFREVRRLHVHD